MMTFLFLIACICALGMSLRGDPLHNLMINPAAAVLRRTGTLFFLEYPVRLQNGTTDYVDLLVRTPAFDLALEFETTPRHVLDNAQKAQAAGLILWVVVPNDHVQKSVARKLEGSNLRPGGLPIRIFNVGQLLQELITIFPRHIKEKPMEKGT